MSDSSVVAQILSSAVGLMGALVAGLSVYFTYKGRHNQFRQVVYGRQEMHELTLRFTGGAIDGGGWDVIGPFTFRGTCDERGNVALTKQYVGRHTVHYQGTYDGEGTIHGRWSIDAYWSGPFALRLDRGPSPAEHAIEAITARRFRGG